MNAQRPGTRHAGRGVGIAAVCVATVLFLLSLLVLFPASTYGLWKVRVIVTECGHFVAALCLITPFVWRRTAWLRTASVIALISAAILLTPMMSAVRVLRLQPQPRPSTVRFIASLYFGHEHGVTPKRITIRARNGAPLVFYYYASRSYAPARVYLPPLVVMIHGGGWHGGAADQLPALSEHLANEGYAVAALTYRFAPQDTFPAQLEDVSDEIAHLRERAAVLGFDPDRMVLLGRSAGGQLALMYAYAGAAVADTVAHALRLQADPRVAGVISLYGPTDLPYGYAHPSNPHVYDSRAILRDYIGGAPVGARDSEYVNASPIHYVPSWTGHTLLVHGSSDDLVSVVQSRRLAAALLEAKHPATLVELPWATHACDYIVHGPCYRISTLVVDRFLARVMPE